MLLHCRHRLVRSERISADEGGALVWADRRLVYAEQSLLVDVVVVVVVMVVVVRAVFVVLNVVIGGLAFFFCCVGVSWYCGGPW